MHILFSSRPHSVSHLSDRRDEMVNPTQEPFHNLRIEGLRVNLFPNHSPYTETSRASNGIAIAMAAQWTPFLNEQRRNKRVHPEPHTTLTLHTRVYLYIYMYIYTHIKIEREVANPHTGAIPQTTN